MAEFYEVVACRRSIRAFRPTEVPRPALERALAAAQSSPSSLNSQPWHFYIASGAARDRICTMLAGSTRQLWDIYPSLSNEQLEKAARFFSDLGGAPVVVVVTTQRQPEGLAQRMAVLAAGGAVLAFQLALAEEGLGSVCVASAAWIEDQMSVDLGLEDEEILTLMPVGYADEQPAARPKRLDKLTWLEEWPQRGADA